MAHDLLDASIMTLFDAPIATTLSRFACLLAIALPACSTSLQGPLPCGDETCGDHQLCVPAVAEPDDGSIPARCVVVPLTCYVHDCKTTSDGTTCAPCIVDLCGCTPGSYCYAEVSGRELRCH